MSLVLAKHTNDEVAIGSIQLASQILLACPDEAQDATVAILKEENAEQILLCLQARLRRFSEPETPSKAARGSERIIPNSGAQRVHVGIGACELIEMLQRLCQVACEALCRASCCPVLECVHMCPRDEPDVVAGALTGAREASAYTKTGKCRMQSVCYARVGARGCSYTLHVSTSFRICVGYPGGVVQ